MRILLTIILIPLFFNSLLSQRDNYAILDSLLEKSCADICNTTNLQDVDSLYLTLSEHRSSSALRMKLVSRLSELGVKVSEDAKTELEILIIKFGVSYSPVPENIEFVNRHLHVKLGGLLIQGLNSVPIRETSYAFSDVIKRENIPSLSGNSMLYDSGPLPETPTGFFDSIIEPVIVIGASALAAFLFFTVRSG